MKNKILATLILIASCYINVYGQGCGLCAKNLTTGLENCCMDQTVCSTCTLATACRGDQIDITHVKYSISPPYDPMNCNPTYWSIYISCTGSTPGPLYQPVFITSTSMYSMNTASMPAGVYWISAACCPPPSGGCCATGLYQIVIRECDSLPKCNKCDCGYEMWFSDFTIDDYGYAYAVLEFPPGPPAGIVALDRLRITLVNYHSEAMDECKKCDIPGQEMFGDIIYAPALYSANPEYAPYNPAVPISYSREVTWCFDEDIHDFNPGSIILGFRFPPVSDLKCCDNDASFCLRIEYWNADCRGCDQLLCLDWDIGHGLAPHNEGKALSKVNLRKGTVEVIPNPAQSSFNMKITKDDLPGQAFIYDANGSMVSNLNITTETTQVDSKNWQQGIYFIRYLSKTGSYTGKVVIDK